MKVVVRVDFSEVRGLDIAPPEIRVGQSRFIHASAAASGLETKVALLVRLGVTDRHRDHVRQFFPRESAKIVSFDELTGLGDIADPYGGSDADYRALREQLMNGMPKIVERIKVGRTAAGEPKMPLL